MSTTPTDRPRTRQRVHKPPPTLNVPDIDEDAAERKRVLNVLAQRRYRQRKREARLGARAAPKGPAQSQSSEESPQATSFPSSGGPNATEAAAGDAVDFPFLSPEDLHLPVQSADAIPGSFDISQLGDMPLQWPTYGPQETYCQPDVPAALPFDLANAVQPLSLTLLSGTFDTHSSSDTSNYTLSPASTTIPLTTTTTTTNYPTPTTAITTTASPTTITTTETESFADSYYLPVPPLTLLRALVRIATRLNAMPSAWSLTAASPFTTGRGPDPSQLPPAWQPTPTQLVVPHHPVLDLLPWPAVRDRMIGYLSLGLTETLDGDANNNISNCSGSVTGSLLLDFIYDMEDGAEGVRVWGADPYDEANWEVGQVVFERWWFVFDKRVIEASNRWRRRRGAEPLRIAGAR